MKKSLSLLVMSVVLSCANMEEVEPIKQLHLNTPSLNTQNDKLARNFSSALSQALTFQEVRELIKNKISLQFDGDNDLLVAQLVKEPIENLNTTFGELLLSKANPSSSKFTQTRMTSSQSNMTLLDSISKFYPLLQISIPDLPEISADSWNSDEILPLAVIPENIDGDQIPVILPDGDITSYSASTPPENLTMVVGRNERVIALPKGNTSFTANIVDPGLDCDGEPFLSDSNNDYILLTDYYDAQNDCTIASQSGGGSGGVNTNTTCERDLTSNKDRLTAIKIRDMDNFRRALDGDGDPADDAWFGGGLEIHVEIRFGRANGTIESLTKSYYGGRKAWRSCGFLWTNCSTIWYTTNEEIVTWSKDIYGDAMHYVWYEYDGGGTRTETITWTTNINGVPIELSDMRVINIDDDQLSSTIVEYCDNTNEEGFTYSTGRLYFKISQ